ncbi:alkaline phosphatase family protein [Mesorhizobium sp. B2-1-5]|uniref:alkaline phosphatase family protein n=1 Tax=Mesorhizobium sp. B2-1-5 TaxID=2589969 RepID=UPI0015E3EAB5|nr:alkaline phosphatase family protein [Mesorhizobium sp. B2-1-5]
MRDIGKTTMFIGCVGAMFANASANAGSIRHVFVIAMENRDASVIYNSALRAPYIHDTLLPTYAHATNFLDELPGLASEPHYIWMEAGTNRFADHTFKTDSDPIASHGTNNTGSKDHLVSQMKALNVSWMTYQEGLDPHRTGSCPIVSSSHTFYAAKHNPFVFFKDMSGDTPSKNNAECVSHTKAYTELARDMNKDSVASYAFITPNLCNDMHGAPGCKKGHPIKRGDDWLKRELPPIIEWANKNAGVIFITWDEGAGTNKMPFVAIGPGVKAGYSGSVFYNHGSILKSIEEIFGLSSLPTVAKNNDLSDLFRAGYFP